MRYFNHFDFEVITKFEGLDNGAFSVSLPDFSIGQATRYDYYEAPDFGELYKLGLAPDGYVSESFIPGNDLSYAAKDGRLFIDIPANTSTTATAIVNGSVSDTLEVVGDQDWFEVTLTAGQRYTFALDGSGGSALVDPLVRLLDASGGQLATNDDGGPGRNSLLTYEITTTGTYYVSAQAWSGAGVADGTGDYTLTINEVAPIGERTIDGIAHFLTDEFSSRSSYNAGGGGATTINFSFASGANSMTAGQEALARRALDAWADIANINFVEGAGDIVFRNNSSGAFNSNTTNGLGLVLSSDLNVTASWYGGNTDVDSYTYQTFMHEIGHALGLGHAGPYNGSATYGVDNSYLNDSWAYTMMSYFDQNESGYFGDYRFVLGPQISDILAIQDLYGINTTTRNADTVYGYNSTETDVHDFSQFTRAPSLSIYDTGGIDTLDFSGYSADARIDLRDEAFSDVDNIRGVISIARGTIIENAIGGSGADTITGNDASNELTGGAGNDILDGGDGVDYALYSGAAFANYTITDNGDGTFTVTDNVGSDGSDTLSNIEFIRIADVDYALGGPLFTSGDDVFYGTADDDIVDALAGNDVLFGRAGMDELTGGIGDDYLNGGGGNDVLNGGDGVDRLFGLSGDDVLNGDGGDDVLYGGDGADTLNGGSGNDTLIGGLGADVLNGGAGIDRVLYSQAGAGVTANLGNSVVNTGEAAGDIYNGIENLYGSNFDDTLTGDALNNIIWGRTGDDSLNGGGGNDRLIGGVGSDTLRGGQGNDILFGQDGDDNLYGSEGNDYLYGDVGNDYLNGGFGLDTLYGGEGADRLYGLADNDTLNGDAGNDFLYGGSGSDTLNGGDGDDFLNGGLGGDVIDGGAGIDRVLYNQSTAAITVNLGNSAVNTGEAAGDTYISIENLYGSNFDDMLSGDAGANTVWGGIGNDVINGGAGDDRLIGGVGNDELHGDQGVDILFGQDGDDDLFGSLGNDRLSGGNGSDRLTGGDGNDSLFGGAGTNTFSFGLVHGDDTINDFTQGSDLIEYVGGPADFAALTITQVGADVLITSSSGTITVFAANTADFTSADFVFIVPSEVAIPDIKLVSDDFSGTADKPVVSDDSFMFVDKSVVSEDLLGFGGVNGDFVLEAGYAIDQDLMAEFLAQAQADFDFNADVDGRYELGLDAELNHHDYFTDFFSVV